MAKANAEQKEAARYFWYRDSRGERTSVNDQIVDDIAELIASREAEMRTRISSLEALVRRLKLTSRFYLDEQCGVKSFANEIIDVLEIFTRDPTSFSVEPDDVVASSK